MKIRQVGAEQFHGDGRLYRREEANSRFWRSGDRASW